MRFINTRRGRAAAGLVAVAAAAGTVASAGAHVPGVGNGLAPSSDAPNLRSVAVLSADLGDGQSEVVRYCFDTNVNAGAGASFFIETYDANRSIQGSGTPSVDGADPRCVKVQFANGLDVTQGTIGIVTPGAVTRVGGTVTNFEASEPLGGSVSAPLAGRTTAPDLIDVTVDTTATAQNPGGTVKYTFDEDIDPALPATVGATDPPTSRATLFFFYRDNGTLVQGDRIVAFATDRRSVTVGYDNPVSAGRVFLADDAAVRDRPQSAAVAGLTVTTNSGAGAIAKGTVSRRRLTGASSLGAKQFQLSYDGAVFPTGDFGQLVAVTDDGRSFDGTAVSTGPNNTVIVTFGSLDDTDGVVRIVDFGDGARAGDGVSSAVSQVAVGTANMSPGFTSAPDLLSASYNASTNAVTYTFDEKVDSTGGAFFTFSQSGDKRPASSATFEGNTVRANFDSTSATSVGAGIDLNGGAARDTAGHRSPPNSVSYGVETAPVVTPPVTTPPIVTPPVTKPPVVTTTTRVKYRTSFSSFKVKSKTRYSGRITSSGKGCKSGRRIALKRSGKTIRNGFTKGDGTFSITRAKSQRGKSGIYVVVTERTTSALTCTARSSKKLKKG